MFNILGAAAEYEKEKILERTRRGRFYKAKQKGIVGTVPPFGYDYVKKNFNNFDYEIVAEFPDRKSAFAFETKLINETKGVDQINANKHNKSKAPYTKAQITEYCLLPDCGRYINSSIKRFCCKSHSAKYAALRGHGKI
jgi:DNA invertase Pin-like site-specific DNA recombinase